MIIAQMLPVCGDNALARATPYPRTHSAQDEQIVERQAGTSECGLPTVFPRREREGRITIEHERHEMPLVPLFPPRSNRRAIPLPNFMSDVIFDRGNAIIWWYQRLRRSTKSSISRRRTCTTGSTF